MDDRPDESQTDDPSAVLHGRWRLLRAHPSLDFAPEAGMDFRAHGELIYSFAVGERRYEIALLYRVSGDVLRTDNPAAPHATAVRFRIGAGDVLVLDFAGAEACFLRDEAGGGWSGRE
ncbi:MAG TPA: hypothetical protein VFS08_18595 [Gemmatimonadaceae bacterium]|nr:hypothetical protein [Gemmatimonadaceae bacterium]